MCVYLQRVQPEHIAYSVESIDDIVYKISYFVSLAEKFLQSELRRIGDCLLDIFEFVVQSDINSIHKIISEHMIRSKSNRPISPTKIQYFWDGLFSTLPAVLYDGQMNISEIKTLITESKHILPVSLDIILSVDPYSNENVSNLTYRQGNDDEFIRGECRNTYNEVMGILMQISSNNNLHQAKVISNLTDQYFFHVLNDLYHRYIIYNCINANDVVTKVILKELERISISVENTMRISHKMNNPDYWDLIKDELDSLNSTSVWLSDQVAAYAINKTTKIDMSNIIGPNLLSSVEILLDHIISVIAMKGMDPLLQQTNGLGKNVHKWYKHAFDILQMLVSNHGDRGVEALHIWKHPVALLETQEILKFKHDVYDAWRSWEMSGSFDKFISEGDAERLILNITKEFANTLHRRLIHTELQLRSARHEVIESLAGVISHFTDIRQQRSTGVEFLL